MGEKENGLTLEERIARTKREVLQNGASPDIRKILTAPFSDLGKYNYPPLDTNSKPKKPVEFKDNRK